ncbi:hypothetical protein FWC31_00920 [Candidatus Saccharibacteria bacterium]|nr:hypothetical protein [Candidatus Saccharibacteria bacterium]
MPGTTEFYPNHSSEAILPHELDRSYVNGYEMILSALGLVHEIHKGQLYGGVADVPKTYHLEKAALTALDRGHGAVLTTALILHDTIEDTSVTLENLGKLFPPAVIQIVRGMTYNEEAVIRHSNDPSNKPNIVDRMRVRVLQLLGRSALYPRNSVAEARFVTSLAESEGPPAVEARDIDLEVNITAAYNLPKADGDSQRRIEHRTAMKAALSRVDSSKKAITEHYEDNFNDGGYTLMLDELSLSQRNELEDMFRVHTVAIMRNKRLLEAALNAA